MISVVGVRFQEDGKMQYYEIDPSLSPRVGDYVITEYGTARLRGRTIPERAEALIGIAHPAFRGQLREDAERAGYLG